MNISPEVFATFLAQHGYKSPSALHGTRAGVSGSSSSSSSFTATTTTITDGGPASSTGFKASVTYDLGGGNQIKTAPIPLIGESSAVKAAFYDHLMDQFAGLDASEGAVISAVRAIFEGITSTQAAVNISKESDNEIAKLMLKTKYITSCQLIDGNGNDIAGSLAANPSQRPDHIS